MVFVDFDLIVGPRWRWLDIDDDRIPHVDEIIETAFNLPANGLRPGVSFDDLIKRTAVRAFERSCPDHDRSHYSASAGVKLFKLRPTGLR